MFKEVKCRVINRNIINRRTLNTETIPKEVAGKDFKAVVKEISKEITAGIHKEILEDFFKE